MARTPHSVPIPIIRMLKKHSSKKLPVRVFLLVLLGTLLWILAGFNYASVTHAQTIPPTCNDSVHAKINDGPSGGKVTLTQNCID